jgi:cytidine deaminase
MTDLELIKTAIEARKRAYAPYSGFSVGAALLTADGRVFTGCNIENAAFTPTNCAERTAFFKAVSEGVRAFEAIAVVGGKGEEPSEFCAPCGVCRQVMAEFCSPDFRIILGNEKNQTVYTLSELLPASFSTADLH